MSTFDPTRKMAPLGICTAYIAGLSASFARRSFLFDGLRCKSGVDGEVGCSTERATPMTCSWRAFSLRSWIDLPILVLLAFAFIVSEVTAARAKEGRLRVVPVLFIPSDNTEIDGGKVAA